MPGSITQSLNLAKSGDRAAAEALYRRLAPEVVRLAAKFLPSHGQAVPIDVEDILQSVMLRVLTRTASNGFKRLNNRRDLLWYCERLTRQRCRDLERYCHRKKRENTSPRLRKEPCSKCADEPTAMIGLSHLLHALPDKDLRRIAWLRFIGCSQTEIAEKMDLSTRSVQRKLALIRTILTRELAAEC